MKFGDPITVRTCANGFIVEAAAPPMVCSGRDDTFVFQSFANLAQWLGEHFQDSAFKGAVDSVPAMHGARLNVPQGAAGTASTGETVSPMLGTTYCGSRPGERSDGR